jgi:hypothetical protein
MELLTTDRLGDIWEKIRSDAEGRRALKRLEEAGFRISHLTPSDATFKRPCWADYVAALPLLPNRPSQFIVVARDPLGEDSCPE